MLCSLLPPLAVATADRQAAPVTVPRCCSEVVIKAQPKQQLTGYLGETILFT